VCADGFATMQNHAFRYLSREKKVGQHPNRDFINQNKSDLLAFTGLSITLY
jgi:hypothetical protein